MCLFVIHVGQPAHFNTSQAVVDSNKDVRGNRSVVIVIMFYNASRGELRAAVASICSRSSYVRSGE